MAAKNETTSTEPSPFVPKIWAAEAKRIMEDQVILASLVPTFKLPKRSRWYKFKRFIRKILRLRIYIVVKEKE